MPAISESSNGTDAEPLISDSGVESASQEAPPDYDFACSAWSLAQLDDDVIESRSSRNDLSILGRLPLSYSRILNIQNHQIEKKRKLSSFAIVTVETFYQLNLKWVP